MIPSLYTDTAPLLAAETPRSVLRAIRLYWTGLAFSAGGTALRLARPVNHSMIDILLALIASALVILIYSWILKSVKLGRNGFRIVLVCFSAIALLFGVSSLTIIVARIADGDAIAMLDLGTSTVNTIAIALLFSPDANVWFRRKASQQRVDLQ